MKRVVSAMGKLPHAVAFDGGFTSMDNLAALKEMGVAEVMFHRKGVLVDTGLMTSTPQIHKALWPFRAGVEGLSRSSNAASGCDARTGRGGAGSTASSTPPSSPRTS